jgi:malate dehydrogenase (oxaloacetate-decarboxylating)
VIGQANNALVFPGLGLGAIAVGAAKITDGMLSAAAHAVASLVNTSADGAPLLPEVGALRDTSLTVAVAVAEAAIADGVASSGVANSGKFDDLPGHVQALMWQPVYRPVRSA